MSNNMLIRLDRLKQLPYQNTVGTLGTVKVDDVFECFALENGHHDEKVDGDTRIDAGIYEIKFREVLSHLTDHYRNKFDWFTWHLELQDVPNFKYVYIHIGNKPEDTDACILVADTADSHQAFVGNSTPIYEDLYKKVSAKLLAGHRVFIQIKDE